MIPDKDSKFANSIDNLLVTSVSSSTSSSVWPLVLYALKHLPLDQVLAYVLCEFPRDIDPEDKTKITTILDSIVNILNEIVIDRGK